MDKHGSFKPIFIVMILSLVIVFLWEKVEFIKNFAHRILDPSLGALLNWNITYGMILIVLGISVLMTLAQKYATDQKTIKEIKERQKAIQQEVKELKDNPAKMMEVQKELWPLSAELMKHSMRPIAFTGIPMILFFRWFLDYFSAIPDFRFFGLLSWFWFYLLSSIIFSSILRKVFKVH